MKIRHGFVSNSSSSSFLVIQEGHLEQIFLDTDKILRLGDLGETEFGWNTTRYTDIYDRINFAWIQTTYQEPRKNGAKRSHLKMLEKVLIEYTGAKEIEWHLDERGWYIDHASSAGEFQNLEMFESEEKLRTFLFSNKSYIQGGNDNE